MPNIYSQVSDIPVDAGKTGWGAGKTGGVADTENKEGELVVSTP